jgi:hypothetical protein
VTNSGGTNENDEPRDRDWEHALFPEANRPPLKSECGWNALARPFRDTGARTPEEARERGYVAIRPYHDRQRSGLWVHENHLPLLEEIARRVAVLRAERRERERRDDERKRALANEALERLPYLTPGEREVARAWALEAGDGDITVANVAAAVHADVVRRVAADAGVPLDARGRRMDLGASTVPVTLWGEPLEPDVSLGSSDLPDDVLESRGDFDPRAAQGALRVRYDGARSEALEAARERLAAFARRLEERDRALPDAARGEWRSAAREALALNPDDLRRAHAMAESVARAAIFDDRLARAQELARTDGGAGDALALTARGREVRVASERSVRLELASRARTVTLQAELAGDPWNERLLEEPSEEFLAGAGAALRAHLDAQEDAWRSVEDAARAGAVQAREQAGYPVDRLEDHVDRWFRKLRKKPISAKSARSAATDIKGMHEGLLRVAREDYGIRTLLDEQRLGNFKDHFAVARSMERTVTLFVGPTNSGKTYHALNELARHESGVYLAPLRLLALEGQEELEGRGVATSFLTGEERDIRPGARFLSATVEMLDIERPVECAVIDEAQLLADPDRGWAWSRALLGVPAKRIVMTGSPDCVPLVEALCAYTGEPLEVRRLPRLTTLEPLRAPVELERVRPGTAIVAFSRRNVLGLKTALEGRYRVATIYGNLSPHVRREEARRFRSGEAEVLVATDAIAMGLNLPIETVLFFETQKFNGEEVVPLTPSQILQIGGRAGRFGKYPTGYVGVLSESDFGRVRAAFAGGADALPDLPAVATVQPSFAHVDAISYTLGTDRLSYILSVFRERMRFDSPTLVSARMNDIRDLARAVDTLPLALRDKFVFATAPVDSRNESLRASFDEFARSFARGRAVPSPRYDGLLKAGASRGGGPREDRQFAAEIAVKNLTVYAWLAYRYPERFPELGVCNEQRFELNALIEELLQSKGMTRRCSQCGEPLAPLSPHGRCDDCFRQGRRRWRETRA